MNKKPCREEIIAYLKELRNRIIASFEEIEPCKRFERKPWAHHSGGGGEIGLLRGEVFEKAAVNWSGVTGAKIPTGEDEGSFFATGVSLITHMTNPHAPTVHFNIRYIETEKRHWLGGGYDLTPMGFPYPDDIAHFHGIAKRSLALYGLYEKFSANAKEYFYIPHRKKERGAGGIFFDHFTTDDIGKDLEMWRGIGDSFCEAIIPIYKKRITTPWSSQEKEVQLINRAHYAEFNLMYDRGTKFGFLSGGNPEAILCSMPPLAKW